MHYDGYWVHHQHMQAMLPVTLKLRTGYRWKGHDIRERGVKGDGAFSLCSYNYFYKEDNYKNLKHPIFHITHGTGVYKAGWNIEMANPDYIFVPGQLLKDHYESIIPESKQKECIVTGWPKHDWLIQHKDEHQKWKDNIFAQFPQLDKDKQIVLFAPTWTNDRPVCSGVLHYVDKIWEQLHKDYNVIIAPHESGKYHNMAMKYSTCIMMDDINDLLLGSDILVTDTSSVGFEFASLGKPVVHIARDRNFDHFKLFGTGEMFLVGSIVTDLNSLSIAITNVLDTIPRNIEKVLYKCDGKATERVTKIILEEMGI